jgi:GAF domain-containing protein
MERSHQLAPLLPTMRLDELLRELDTRLTDVVRTRDRLHELLNAVLTVGSDLDLQTMLRRIVEAAVRLVDAEYGALGVIGSSGYLAQFLTSGVDEDAAVQIGQLPRGHGILGVLIRDPRPLRLADLGSHPAAFGFPPNHPPMRTFLGVPVRVRDEVFGNLYLTEKRGGACFDEEDEAVVLALAAAAGVAIENARLYEDTRRREQWVAASGEISTALLSGREPEDVLPLLATRAAELADATTALVALPHDGEDRLVVEVAIGPASAGLVGQRLAESGSRIAVARQSSQAEVLQVGDGPYELCSGLTVGSAVVVPLGTADGGVLVVAASVDSEPVRAESVSALRTFASQAALALELAARRRDAERLSVYEDRDRIARDLHDVVIQRLFATGMQLESTHRLLTSPEAKARVRHASTTWTPPSGRSGPASTRCRPGRCPTPPRRCVPACSRCSTPPPSSSASRRPSSSPGWSTPGCRPRSASRSWRSCARPCPTPPATRARPGWSSSSTWRRGCGSPSATTGWGSPRRPAAAAWRISAPVPRTSAGPSRSHPWPVRGAGRSSCGPSRSTDCCVSRPGRRE